MRVVEAAGGATTVAAVAALLLFVLATCATGAAIATGDGEGPTFVTMPVPLMSPTAMVALAYAYGSSVLTTGTAAAEDDDTDDEEEECAALRDAAATAVVALWVLILPVAVFAIFLCILIQSVICDLSEWLLTTATAASAKGAPVLGLEYGFNDVAAAADADCRAAATAAAVLLSLCCCLNQVARPSLE